MQSAKEKQQGKRQRSIEAQVRRRWAWTALFLFDLSFAAGEIFEKRSQWPSMFQYPLSPGITSSHSIWWSIFNFVVFSLVLVQFWGRVHNYQREQLQAEQRKALQESGVASEGVWPPPPHQPAAL